MINLVNTIEDLLEVLAGLKTKSTIQIQSSDATIMHSIARQTFKGTALTDRQFALMKEKLQTYRDQFIELEYDFDRAVDTLRQPLRHIDRSKYIKIVDTADVFKDTVYESHKQNWKWIEIRFPFAKKTIMLVNEIATLARDTYYHEKGSHRHFFQLKELHVYNVIEKFKDSGFEIQPELFELHKTIKDIVDNKDSVIPQIKNLQMVNVNLDAVELATNELGPLTKDSVINYVDRRRRYGIEEFDVNFAEGNLQQKIAERDSIDVLFSPKEYRIESILEALQNLDRYPLLVVLSPNEANKDLYNIFNFIKHYISAEQQSVLFRLEDKEHEFNQLVKDYKLNNWVDKSTKIVYINSNKLPKICLSSDWRPIATLSFDSRCNRVVDSYITEFCDLIVYYDNEMSPFRRYSRYYG